MQEIEAQKCRHPPRDACLKPIRSQGITESPADNGKPRGAQKHDAAYNARMAALYREVVLKEKPAQSENGFIPLGALAKPNGNGHSAAGDDEAGSGGARGGGLVNFQL